MIRRRTSNRDLLSERRRILSRNEGEETMNVKLKVLSGPIEQSEYVFDEPGGFTFGRAPDCTCRMPESDNTSSRNHFLLEITPPNLMLKDLGSLNGTYVNDAKHGGRSEDVNPEDADISPAVALRDGDKIQAGQCVLKVMVHAPAVCVDCAREIPSEERKAAEFVGGTYLCNVCRNKEEKAKKRKHAGAKSVKRPALAEIKMDMAQREKAEHDPGAVIEELMKLLAGAKEEEKPPAIKGYREMTLIGKGGFGAVYSAIRAGDGTKVALKTMLQTRKPPKRQMLMFEREMEIAKQLRHLNIVHCGEASVWNDLHFIEMEHMDSDLYSLMKKNGGWLSLREAASIMLDSLEGLAYAHKAKLTVTLKKGPKSVRGVVHRDLKPQNILLSGKPGQWTAKVTDFGLAKAFSEAGFTKGSVTAGLGDFCGSPAYVAPEHVVNYRHVKPVTDVFEIAATFYHMLTGHLVWPMRRGEDALKAALQASIKPIEKLNPEIPKTVAAVFGKALDRDQDERYPDGAAFLKAMKKAL